MRSISYNTVKKNSALTDFSCFKEMVIANAVRDVPKKLKTASDDTNSVLDFYM